ncbi:TetR/AcrR family transcriptional regulator [Phormidesmis priestleyi]
MGISKDNKSSRKLRQVRDAEVTRQQILNAAEVEFSRHGLNGARVSAIAQGAGVTTAMIHYYFESKEGLYKSVLERPATEASTELAKLNLDQLPPIQALEQFIRAAITYETMYPLRQMLWFQEANQNRGEYFKLSKENWSNVHYHLPQILARGTEDGSFRQLDLMLTTVHILGVCIFYFTIQENWKHLTPEVDRLSSERVEQHTKAAIDFILAGVRAIP